MGALHPRDGLVHDPARPAREWPQSLRSAVSILLPSQAQIVLFWGPDLIDDLQRRLSPGVRREASVGARAARARVLERGVARRAPALFEGVVGTGEAFWAKDHLFLLERHGYPEETYFDVSYDPVRDEGGSRRRCLLHRERDDRARRSANAACGPCASSGRETAEARLGEKPRARVRRGLAVDPEDVPFALLYLFDAGPGRRLAATAGVERGRPVSPRVSDRPRSGGAVAARAERGARSCERLDRCVDHRSARSPAEQAPASAWCFRIARGAQERPSARSCRGQPAPALRRGLPRLPRPRRRPGRAASRPTRAPTRRSASAPRRWPSSTAPRRPSSATSATSFARRSP